MYNNEVVLAILRVKIWHDGRCGLELIQQYIVSSVILHIIFVLAPRLCVLWGHYSNPQSMCAYLQKGSQNDKANLWHQWSYQERALKLTDYNISWYTGCHSVGKYFQKNKINKKNL